MRFRGTQFEEDALCHGASMDWNWSPEWDRATGDAGPWIWYLPLAWQAAAARTSATPIPSRPLPGAAHEDVIAFWGPLLHLLIYGLGWRRPDAGLATWRAHGWPVDDPILRTVERWWGHDGVLDVLAWAAVRGSLDFSIETDLGGIGSTSASSPIADDAEYERRRGLPEWQQVWGGGSDSMHLTVHVDQPLVRPEVPGVRRFDLRGEETQGASWLRTQVMCESYLGWYAALLAHEPSIGPNGRSVRTDVVVKPIGWLGEFRRHRQTGLWFRGTSTVHLWGNPDGGNVMVVNAAHD